MQPLHQELKHNVEKKKKLSNKDIEEENRSKTNGWDSEPDLKMRFSESSTGFGECINEKSSGSKT